MLAIKLRRIGKKHQPSYRLVVAEKRSKPKTTGIEDLGWVNSLEKKQELKRERIEYWLKVGAEPTASVHNLLVRAGISAGPKIPVHKKSKTKEETKSPSVNSGQATSEKKEEAKKAESPAAEHLQ